MLGFLPNTRLNTKLMLSIVPVIIVMLSIMTAIINWSVRDALSLQSKNAVKCLKAEHRAEEKLLRQGVMLASESVANLLSKAAENITLSTGEYPPFNSTSLKHNGLIPKIVTEAFRLEGVMVEYKFYPWKRAYRFSENYFGKARERKAYLAYSDDR